MMFSPNPVPPHISSTYRLHESNVRIDGTSYTVIKARLVCSFVRLSKDTHHTLFVLILSYINTGQTGHGYIGIVGSRISRISWNP